MQTTTSLHGSLSRHRLRSRRLAALTVVTVATVSAGALLTGCGSSTASSTDAGTGSRPSGDKDSASSPGETESDQRVLWMGDSIAAAEAPALQAALEASGVEFENASSDGGGTVVEGDKDAINSKIAKTTWKGLEKSIDGFRPNVIAYQITTYDWGTPEQQEASYGNALRHGGPTVRVHIRAHADAESFTLTLTVADDGPGIPREILPHIFDRYSKGDAARTRSEGSGLGLAIAAENAHLHGGTLTAANAPDGGAVFTLTLPRNPG